MTGYEFCGGYCASFWWIFPLVMIILCFFFMRRGNWSRNWRFGRCWGTGESAIEILNKRYASGEIDQSEYEEKKSKIESFHE